MKQAIDWHCKTGRSREFMKFLKPIRSQREVARILGIGRGEQYLIEKSALTKICLEMRKFAEREGIWHPDN